MSYCGAIDGALRLLGLDKVRGFGGRILDALPICAVFSALDLSTMRTSTMEMAVPMGVNTTVQQARAPVYWYLMLRTARTKPPARPRSSRSTRRTPRQFV